MNAGIDQFYHLNKTDYHQSRKREIMAKYGPQIVQLQGPNSTSAYYIVVLVALSFSLAIYFNNASWWLIVPASFFIGAFIHHALYVQIHECTHNLVFRTRFSNKLMGLICDLPLVFPSSMAFRKYHMYHHRHLGHEELDPDVPPQWEAQLIGNTSWRKALWIILYFISQATRPAKMKSVTVMNFWMFFNIIFVLLINLAILTFIGPKALGFLFLSTAFALGLHPLGGRWIQEHFVTQVGQETYSYYGPLNKLCFNMGYHNEHHDFMNVAWNNLPKLKALAPEFYNNLKSYQSWIGVISNFIFNPKLSPYSRYVHRARHNVMEESPMDLNLQTQLN
jgi:sphingolipid delta-4 desaturase